jgi:dTDP-4-dehydrorhamnose reductase
MLVEPPVSSGPYLSSRNGANFAGRTLLFGATSITGYAITRQQRDNLVAVTSRAATARRFQWKAVDAEDAAALAALIADEHPETVIWTHAVCDVARCEGNPTWATTINVRGVENLLRSLPLSTRLVYVSSDHVFGNDGSYTETSKPCPISVYGRTRVAAERVVLERPGSLVVRPGLAIGASADGRSGFHDWLAYRHGRGLAVTVIGDESRSAVWADDLAERILALAASRVVGLRHIPGARAVPRPELARYLLGLRSIEPRFEVRTRAEQPAPHLGRIELRSDYDDEYGLALPAVA